MAPLPFRKLSHGGTHVCIEIDHRGDLDFLFENVLPGKHVIKLQWRSAGAGETVAAGAIVAWTMFVP